MAAEVENAQGTLAPDGPAAHLANSLLNKKLIIEKIIATLAAELENCARSARSAHAEATDEQNKAENKYDTRGLEASYLAQAQSVQAGEVMQAIQHYESLDAHEFSGDEAIHIGALVELERQGERMIYFVGPLAGGAEVECEGRAVLVITPHSPLGRQLIGRKENDRLQINIGKASDSYQIVAVS